jgi:hypothetical protein
MIQDKRLDKVTKSLTPKQAVVLWLQEIQQYRNVEEYVRFLRSQPESEAPITRLTRQIDESIRAEMKGKPKQVVETAVRRTVKDVVFLIKLHLQVNFKVMNESRIWRLQQVALAEALHGMRIEIIFRNIIVDLADQVNYQTPYPLGPDMAAAVNAAIRNHVYTWESLEDEGIVEDWLWNHLVDNGAKGLPENSSEFKDGQYQTTVNQLNENVVRACFTDDVQFELFRSGQDYTHGLASMTDAEYNRHYESVVSFIRELADSGQVKKGMSVFLEMVPVLFLKKIPIVDGEWLDRQVVELAEMSVMLQTRGYHLQEDQDRHCLSQGRFANNNGEEAAQKEIQIFRRQAARRLKKFTGRVKKIDGRVYIHFKDYNAWRGRMVKGDLQEQVNHGLVTASWNKWVGDQDSQGVANINGVPIGTLSCSVDDSSYYACRNVEEQLRNRESIVKDMRFWHHKLDWKQELITAWRQILNTSLVELYATREAFTYISKGYFDGQQILFSDLANEMADIITSAETTVNNFNAFFVDLMQLSQRIDLDVLRQNGVKEANPQIAYLVDMAKAEALDCLGDEQAAVKLAEPYL